MINMATYCIRITGFSYFLVSLDLPFLLLLALKKMHYYIIKATFVVTSASDRTICTFWLPDGACAQFTNDFALFLDRLTNRNTLGR